MGETMGILCVIVVRGEGRVVRIEEIKSIFPILDKLPEFIIQEYGHPVEAYRFLKKDAPAVIAELNRVADNTLPLMSGESHWPSLDIDREGDVIFATYRGVPLISAERLTPA